MTLDNHPTIKKWVGKKEENDEENIPEENKKKAEEHLDNIKKERKKLEVFFLDLKALVF